MIINTLLSELPTTWQKHFKNEYDKPYFKTQDAFLSHEMQHETIFPPQDLWFQAFKQCDFDTVSVVIIGQDPYHNVGQAHGLCFSVRDDCAIPPSLKNIFQEIHTDTKALMPTSGNLQRWAKQGILLLNATLTVRANQAGSHQKQGWEIFTDTIIEKISTEKQNIVFLLWGAYALKKRALIDTQKHLVLTAPHPSPLSAHRGFKGSKHFSKPMSI